VDAKRIAAILYRRKWIILLTLLATLAVVIIGSLRMTPVYGAQTVLRVLPAYGRVSSPSDLQYVERLIQTYNELLTSRPYLQEVILRLGLPFGTVDLADRINVEPVTGTELLKIGAEDRDPVRAAAIANTLATVLTESEAQNVRIAVVEPALTPQLPSRPRIPIAIALALLVGLAGGAALALAIEYMDSSVHSVEDVGSAIDVPQLGQVPPFRSFDHTAPRLIGASGDAAPIYEAFRVLGVKTLAAADAKGARSLMVTGAGPESGSSTVTANLAVSMAEGGRQVILVDGNARHPWVQATFALGDGPGLKDVLQDLDRLDAALQWTSVPGLRVLPWGTAGADAAQALRSSELGPLQAGLEARAALVVWDAPPVQAADTLVLAPQVDGALVVATSGQTKREDLQEAMSHLEQVGGRVLGVALAGVPARRV
jgi:capsular exopolysaccharide synthesis family protein